MGKRDAVALPSVKCLEPWTHYSIFSLKSGKTLRKGSLRIDQRICRVNVFGCVCVSYTHAHGHWEEVVGGVYVEKQTALTTSLLHHF